MENMNNAFEKVPVNEQQPQPIQNKNIESISRSPEDVLFESKILGTDNLDSLLRVLEKNGGIKGSQKQYDYPYLRSLLIRVVLQGDNINLITNTCHLRDKVAQIIAQDKIRIEAETLERSNPMYELNKQLENLNLNIFQLEYQLKYGDYDEPKKEEFKSNLEKFKQQRESLIAGIQ